VCTTVVLRCSSGFAAPCSKSSGSFLPESSISSALGAIFEAGSSGTSDVVMVFVVVFMVFVVAGDAVVFVELLMAVVVAVAAAALDDAAAAIAIAVDIATDTA